MRFSILCVALIGLAGPSLAADLPVLRGTSDFIPAPTHQRWGGVYVGGQASYSSAGADFSKGTSDLVGYILRNTTLENEAHVSRWTTLSKDGTTGTGFGGFVGYNSQWDDAVIGVELNYTHTDLKLGASDSLGRSYQTSDGYFYDVDVSGEAAIRLTDLATLRLRAGWAAGAFMPYGFVAAAAGRADLVRSATVALTAVDLSGVVPPRPDLALGPITQNDNRTGAFAFGYGAGGGVEMALMSSLFLRTEYEYVRLGFSGVNLNVNTVRAAVGAKF